MGASTWVHAHAGHWLVNVAYATPLLVLGALLAWDRLKGRSGRRAGDD